MDTLDGKVKWLKKNDDAIKEWVKKNFVLKGIHNDIKSFKVKLRGIKYQNKSIKRNNFIKFLILF